MKTLYEDLFYLKERISDEDLKERLESLEKKIGKLRTKRVSKGLSKRRKSQKFCVILPMKTNFENCRSN